MISSAPVWVSELTVLPLRGWVSSQFCPCVGEWAHSPASAGVSELTVLPLQGWVSAPFCPCMGECAHSSAPVWVSELTVLPLPGWVSSQLCPCRVNELTVLPLGGWVSSQFCPCVGECAHSSAPVWVSVLTVLPLQGEWAHSSAPFFYFVKFTLTFLSKVTEPNSNTNRISREYIFCLSLKFHCFCVIFSRGQRIVMMNPLQWHYEEYYAFITKQRNYRNTLCSVIHFHRDTRVTCSWF